MPGFKPPKNCISSKDAALQDIFSVVDSCKKNTSTLTPQPFHHLWVAGTGHVVVFAQPSKANAQVAWDWE